MGYKNISASMPVRYLMDIRISAPVSQLRIGGYKEIRTSLPIIKW
jgi:hypothetical protein